MFSSLLSLVFNTHIDDSSTMYDGDSNGDALALLYSPAEFMLDLFEVEKNYFLFSSLFVVFLILT